MSTDSPTVFVVEDDAEMCESFAALFTSQGLAVETFSSGEEFLTHYDSSRPGCIVADFRLQGINGIDLHRLLADRECTLPVVLISGYLTVRSAVAAVRQGIYRILEKPYHENDLLSAVHDALQENRSSREKKTCRTDFYRRLQSLNARERLTLEMIVAGHGNKAIERKLGLSTRTVDRIRSSILEKTGCMSFVELSAAYGAARAAGRTIMPSHAAGSGDACADRGAGEESLECLCAGLLRVQAVLFSEGDIGEDCRPLLRDAESALSKALGRSRAVKSR